jgi:hypothetical protein
MTTDLPEDDFGPEDDLERWDRYNNILAEVFGETERQNDLWGEQNHPMVSPEDPTGLYLLGKTYRSMEILTKQRFERGERSWALIELEEIFEAAAERDPGKARVEWLQVAAVAVSVVAALDRAAGLTPAGPPMELTIDGRTVDDVPLPDDTPTRDLRIMTTGIFDDADPVPPLRPVTPEEIDAQPTADHYAKDLDEDFRPTERAVRQAECVINNPRATVDQVAEADAVLTNAEDLGFIPELPVDPAKHTHTFDRLHGLCRCGEAKS